MDDKVIPIIVTLGLFVGIGALVMLTPVNEPKTSNEYPYRPYGGTLRRKHRTQNKSKRK